jgi:hypothetical protein
MLQLTILLEKLYRHKSDLEFIMSMGIAFDRTKFKGRYKACLHNIEIYERRLKLFPEMPSHPDIQVVESKN